MNDNDLSSRTRPGKQPDPVIAVLRELRSAVRSHIVVLDTSLAALQSIEDRPEPRPELGYLISALRVATGRRGSAFGTAHGITVLLDNLLGESGYSPEEEKR